MTNPERFSTGLFLTFTLAQVYEPEIKTSLFGHVSGDFESAIESGNFKSENFWIWRVLSCKWISLETGYFPPVIFWVCGRTKMADLVMESSPNRSQIDGHWWRSLVASFCHRFPGNLLRGKWYSSGARISKKRRIAKLRNKGKICNKRLAKEAQIV